MKNIIRFFIVISLIFSAFNVLAQTASKLPPCQGSNVTAWSQCTGNATFPKGSIYVGEWLNGKPDGQGSGTFPNGDKFVGSSKNGKLNGLGTYTWADGKKYVGSFNDGQPNGQGTFTYPDGTKYVGEVVNTKKNGQGTLTFGDGRPSQVGLFKDDVYVGAQQATAPQQQAQAPQQQPAPKSNVASNYQTSSGLRKQINVLKYLDTRDEQNHLAYIAGIHGVFMAAMNYGSSKTVTEAINQNKPTDRFSRQTLINRQTLKIGSLFSEVNAKRNWTESQKQVYKQVMERTEAVFLSENQMDDKAESEIFDQCESLIKQMQIGDEISAGRQAVNKFVENLDQVAEANRQKFLARTAGGQSVAELTCLVQGEDISPGKKFTINLTRVPVRVVKVPEEKGKLAIYIRGVDISYEAKSWDSDYNYKLGNFNFNGRVTGNDLSTSNEYKIMNIGTGKGPLGDSTTALVISLDRKTGNLSVLSGYYEQKYGDKFLWDYPTAVKRFSGFCEKADTSTGNKF